MNTKISNLIRWMCMPMLVMIFANITGNISAAATFVIYTWILWGCCIDAKDNVYIIFFLISFFVFLLGQPFAREFLGSQEKYGYGKELTTDAKGFMYLLLSSSLLSLYAGYKLFSTTRLKKENYARSDTLLVNRTDMWALQRIARVFTLILYGLVFIRNIERAIYVAISGYLSSYLGYVSILPSFIHGLADIAPVAISLYLATLPKKKDAKSILVFYCFAEGVSLFTGRRYEAVASMLFVILYCILRNEIDDEKWVGKRFFYLVILSIPAVIIFLIAMESWRMGYKSDLNAGEMIVKFFESVGGSSTLIGYANMYEETLRARDVLFSFGNIARSLSNNVVARALGVEAIPTGHTIESALYSGSLGAALMYEINPNRYLAGGGLGSCYIAELYLDFSYAGVIVGNVVLGAIIAKLKKLESNSILKNFVVIFIIVGMIRIPRDSVDYFLNQFIAIKNIAFLMLMYALTTWLTNRQKRPWDTTNF